MMYETIVDFVKLNTKEFDESHDVKHAIIVYQLAKNIMDSFGIEYDQDILMFAGLLHDVRDHKYPNSISSQELEAFVRKHLCASKTAIVMRIIDNISYSKEAAGKREEFKYPYVLYLDAISDADRLQALGAVGVMRCETFTRARGGKVPEDVVQHCHDKLLKLYPQKYIKTEFARKLAEPLHEEIVKYVEKHTPMEKVENK